MKTTAYFMVFMIICFICPPLFIVALPFLIAGCISAGKDKEIAKESKKRMDYALSLREDLKKAQARVMMADSVSDAERVRLEEEAAHMKARFEKAWAATSRKTVKRDLKLQKEIDKCKREIETYSFGYATTKNESVKQTYYNRIQEKKAELSRLSALV